MKNILLILLVFSFAAKGQNVNVVSRVGVQAIATSATPAYFDFIIAGQSNVVGRDYTLGTWTYTTSAQIQSFDSSNKFATANPLINNIDYKEGTLPTRNNIGFQFAKEYLVNHTIDTVRFISRGQGSTPSSEWTPKTSGAGEATGTNVMLTDLITKINATPSNFKAKVVLWHQGEYEETSAALYVNWLNNLTEIYDTLRKHTKVDTNFYMVVGFPDNIAYPNITTALDSLLFKGIKDLGSRNIITVPYYFRNLQQDFADSLSTHWSNEAINKIGKADYYEWDKRFGSNYIKPIRDTSFRLSTASGSSAGIYTTQDVWIGAIAKPTISVPFGVYQTDSTKTTLAKFQLLNNIALGAKPSLRLIYLNNGQLSNGGIGMWYESAAANGTATYRNAIYHQDTSIQMRNAASALTASFGENVITLTKPLTSNTTIISSATVQARNLLALNARNTDAFTINTDATGGSGNGITSGMTIQLSSLALAAIRGSYETSRGDLHFAPSSNTSTYTDRMVIRGDGLISIGVGIPSASMHFKSGTTSAGSAPIKLAYHAPVKNTTAEKYALEVDSVSATSSNIYWTDASATRYTLAKTLTNTATLDFGSTAAGAVTDLTITVTGAEDGDVVNIGVPNGSIVASGSFSAWVSASNTVTIRYANNDLTTARDPASGTFRASVIKY